MELEDRQPVDLAQPVQNYVPGPAVTTVVRQTPIVLLVGISGAGKDTIKQHLLATGQYHHIVSHTTRAPRENGGVLEQDGIEYHFISTEAASNMLKHGEFVEAKEYSGNLYGTSAAEIQWAQDANKIAITDIEVQGVAEYKAISPNVIAIFILPPDFDEWQHRLQARYGANGANSDDMTKRMRTAIQELEEALKQPYYHFVINDDLDRAVDKTNKIAHNHDEFNQVDDEIRARAEQLLEALRRSI